MSQAKLTHKTLLLILFATMPLSACAAQPQNDEEAVSLASMHFPSSELNNISVRFDGIPKAYQLISETNNRIKLVAKNNQTLIVEHGRIISTSNLDVNLLSIKAKEKDPLTLGLLNASTPKTWTRKVLWSSQKKAIEVKSKFEYSGKKSILLQHAALDSYLFTETVDIPSMKATFVNKFWLNYHNGQLIKSEQIIAPDQSVITFIAPQSPHP